MHSIVGSRRIFCYIGDCFWGAVIARKYGNPLMALQSLEGGWSLVDMHPSNIGYKEAVEWSSFKRAFQALGW